MTGEGREIFAPLLGDEQAEHDHRLTLQAAGHPAARITSPRLGVHRVTLQAAADVPVYGPGDPAPIIGRAEVPAVHALECYRCGALLRPGPTVALHLQGHRDDYAARRPWRRRALRTVRGALYRITHTSARS